MTVRELEEGLGRLRAEGVCFWEVSPAISSSSLGLTAHLQ